MALVIADKAALAIVARSVSTSYKEVLTPTILADILRSGVLPERYAPHLMSLLDEVPLSLVDQAVSEASTDAVSMAQIRRHLGRWAKQWQVCRQVWQ